MDITRVRIKLPVEITHLQLGVPQDYRQQMIKELYRIGDKMNQTTNVKASMTSYEIWNDSPKFDLILDNILKITDEHLISDPRYKNVMTSAWGAIYKEGHYTLPHEHDPAVYSWVYYLKVDEHSSPLVFDNNELILNVKDDLLVLFPGNVTHMVPKQTGGGDRLVLAGNTSWKTKNSDNEQNLLNKAYSKS